MATNEALILQISADVRRIEKALNQVRGTTNRQLSAVEQRFDRMNAHVRRSGDDMARDLRASIAAIGIGVAIREVSDYSDSWTSARNKIAAAGVEQDKLADTMQRIVGLAKETGSNFDATADLYARVQRSASKLGLTQEDVLKITEQVNKAFVAGGAAAGEQASGILQLGQALGSGVLQGDELKSIRENAPLLAQAIADEFNTTIAGLKKLGAEGELTSDRVAKAILNANSIQEQFGRTTKTVAQSIENLRTEFTRYVADSKVAQATVQTLTGFLKFATDNLNTLADAAIVAASVIGGTLAVAAIGRFVVQLLTVVRTAREAATALQALRIAMTFFSGPIGAVILGIGAALGTLAFNTNDSASAADRAAQSFRRVEEIQADITSGQKALETAQKKLTQAIVDGGEAAKTAATLEVDRLRKNLEGNQALLNIEKARAAVAIRDRAREFETKRVPVPFVSEEQNKALFGGGLTLQQQFGVFAGPALAKRGQTGSEFVAEMAIKAQTKALTEEEKALLSVVSAMTAYDEEMKGLQERLNDLNDINLVDPNDILPFPTEDGAGGKSGGASSAVKGYRTDLEKLRDTLKELGEEAKKDADLVGAAVMSVDSLQQNGNRSAADFASDLEDANQQLTELQEKTDQRAIERSRRAVQAILDLANSDLSAAFKSIPSFSDILTGEDVGLVRSKLKTMAEAAAEAVAAGQDKIEAEFINTITEIERARQAAIAAGITDMNRFDNAVRAAFEKLDSDLSELLGPVDVPDSLKPDLQAVFSPDLPDFVDELQGLRDGIREGVKAGLREGIQTDDWGQALRNAVAEAVTRGFDEAINVFADALTDILTGRNQTANALFSSIGSFFGFGGARAAGGPVAGGKTYLVGERGPELLTMGGNGQVLNAALTNRILNAKGTGGAVSIYAPLIVQGSIDAVTWPKVEAAMRSQAQRIMSAVPGAVNATLIDNRIQKRRL
jgi:tape measure domain-containing protein